jgi:hypothetical protein
MDGRAAADRLDVSVTKGSGVLVVGGRSSRRMVRNGLYMVVRL